MFTFRKHKIFNAALFILFFIYAVSPLTSSFDRSKKYLRGESTFRAKDVSIFFVDFLYHVISKGDDAESGQPDDENANIIVKKKRALTRKLDKTSLVITAIVSHIVPMDLFAFSGQPNIEIAFADHKTNTKTFKGFLPLYSGLSPPIA